MTDLATTLAGLTAAQRAAVAELAAFDMRRVRGGWLSPTGTRISLDTASALRAARLARSENTAGRLKLVATGGGLQIAAVMAGRKRR